jgi:hypothetical protein
MIITDENTLEILVRGMSHFIALGEATKAVIYYGADGASHMRVGDGKIMQGTWTFTAMGYDVDWTDGPNGSWSFEYEGPGRICYIDRDGKNHGPITKIVPGDVAGMAG